MPSPDPNLIGPIAGVVTSVLWTSTSIFFSIAGRRLGSTVVNATRIALAIVLLGLIHRFVISDDGTWIPHMQGPQIWLLAASGIIGLAIGDQCLFTAFVDIGPRLSNLLMTTAPVFAALLSLVFLGEVLSWVAWLGMGITLAGIAWVILERSPHPARTASSPHRLRGVILAITGGFCQAAGLMLSKAAMGHGWLDVDQHMDPQAATFVRMMFAGVGIVPILVIARSRFAPTQRVARIGRRSTGFAFTMFGTIVGPVFGVWLSLVAADATDVGIAQTLLSLTPIFILPYAAFIEREHISWRAIIGAVIAVIGVAVLFGEA